MNNLNKLFLVLILILSICVMIQNYWIAELLRQNSYMQDSIEENRYQIAKRIFVDWQLKNRLDTLEK